MCSRLYCAIEVCVSTLYDVRTTTKSPNDAFLRTYPRRQAMHISILQTRTVQPSSVNEDYEGTETSRATARCSGEVTTADGALDTFTVRLNMGGRSGIQSQRGRDFPHPSSLAAAPTQSPVQCVPGLFAWSKVAGVWR